MQPAPLFVSTRLVQVIASYGHVRDLANKAGSVKPEEDWSLVWQPTKTGEATMKELMAASAGCRALLLATDPDREGEAISWHITEELKVRFVNSVRVPCAVGVLLQLRQWMRGDALLERGQGQLVDTPNNIGYALCMVSALRCQ
jgi:hypothetical protein